MKFLAALALIVSVNAFATEKAAKPAAAAAPVAAATAMTEADAKKACADAKAADMTKCVAEKTGKAAAKH